MYKAFFIDIDNTLLDFDAYVYETMQKGFEKFSLISFEAWMYDVFVTENNKLWRRLEDGLLSFEELQLIRWNTVFEKIGVHFDGIRFENYFREELHNSAIPVKGAYSMLEALKNSGYVLCIASNGPYAQQMNRLRISGMEKFFDWFFISEDIGFSKPSYHFYAEAFRRMNESRCSSRKILPDECIMLGDSLTSDIQGGKNYGMHTAYFSRGETVTEQECVPHLWDEWFMSLEDVERKYTK